MDPASLVALLLACAPMVDPVTSEAIVSVESGTNPFAIGVVGGTLDRQPTTRAEALATTAALRDAGWNFSVGLGQINVHNFERLGLTPSTAFDSCRNLRAMQTVLIHCFDQAAVDHRGQSALRHALSCYYSGDFALGFRDGYVTRVAKAAARIDTRLGAIGSAAPVPNTLTNHSRSY